MNNFCISITTIPSRLSEIYLTLESFEKQSLLPKKVFLNIPNKYLRFPNEKIQIPDLSNKFEKIDIQINRCEDFGPGTKLMGGINNLDDFDYVILLDDDSIYHSKVCEYLNAHYNENNDTAYSFFTVQIYDLVMGQGTDGFLIPTKYLKKIREFFDIYVRGNKYTMLNDDFWMSFYLAKYLEKPVKVTSLEHKTVEYMGSKYIYENHSQINPLHKLYMPILSRRTFDKLNYWRILTSLKMKKFFKK